MKGVKFASTALGLVIGVLAAVPASAWERGTVNDFFTLPDLKGQPTGSGVKSSVEGLTVGLAPDNNIYAASSGINSGTTPEPTGPANLFVIDSGSRLVRQVVMANSSPFVLGIRFNPMTKALWVLDSENAQVLNVDTTTGAVTKPFPRLSKVSALRVVPSGKPLARTLEPIVVNSDGTAGGRSTFINGINAPDGIAIDDNGNTWICANQEDEIVVIDNTGKVIAKLGDFKGLTTNRTIKGLLFPTSLAFSNDKSTLYVSNLASPSQRAIDSAWATQVQNYTISSLTATIPPLQ
jgi:sugar lactone lactonase YvrE